MSKITNEQIKDFLKTYCTKVRKKESDSYVELMMDNHKCIEFEEKQYYVPEENSSWTDLEENIYELLVYQTEPEHFYVDVPNTNGGDEWQNVLTCDTREEAIKYAMETFGADENGCICLVSQS